jgi:hypothetical protein
MCRMSATLAERLRDQSAECARLGSPLYAGLLASATEDLEAGGVVAEAFAGREDLPGRVVPGLRLLGAVHRLVLQGRAPEVGASAGLNLRADRFAYQVGGATLGDPTSPVRLAEPWVGVPFRDPGRVRVRVVERAGCDPDPVDPTTEEGRLTLASYVWADQVERMARLRAALRVAAAVPARVERAGAADWLERVLAEPAPAGADLTVVWHSAVWPYLEREERARVEAAIAAAGRARREGAAPLARLGLESRRVADRHVFELRITGWSLAGERHLLLAQAEGHGPPVRWWPAGSVSPAAG